MNSTHAREILQAFRDSVASEGICPDCLKNLTEDQVCKSCGYDIYFDDILQDGYEGEMDDEPL